MGLGQSWTDPFTNHTFLTNIDVTLQLEELVGVGSTPKALLMPLMHEATHHWTFLSPVGNALALLTARARRGALRSLDTGNESQLPVLLDMVSTRTTTKLLQPFAEGLALAMEFDCVNHKSAFISGPFMAVTRAFAPVWPGIDSTLAALPACEALMQARRSQAGVSRKLNVYGDPLDVSGAGYLLGYLSVRSMMRTLSRACGRLLEEGDLCVSYLRTYMYGDWQLVDLLLERDVDELSHARAINDYISDRLWNIDKVTSDDVDRFELLAAADTPTTDLAYADALRFDRTRAHRGLERVKKLALELEEVDARPYSPEFEELSHLLLVLDREIILTRPFVYLGGTQADVEVREGKCAVSVQGRTIVDDLPSDAPAGAGPGDLDVFYESSAGGRRLMHVTRDDITIATAVRGPTPDDKPPEEFAPHRSRRLLREISALFENLVGESVASSWMQMALDHLEKQTPLVRQGLYLDVALRFAAVDRRDHLIATLGRGGLRAYLDNDRDLSEALAVIGASPPLRPLIISALVAEKLGEAHLDALLAKSEDGLELLSSNGPWVIAHV